MSDPEPPADLPALLRRRALNGSVYERVTALRTLATDWRDAPSTAAFVRDRLSRDGDYRVRKTALHALVHGWGLTVMPR